MINGKVKYSTVIDPSRKTMRYWKDVWNYRGLFYFLAWRDILVRYKQTTIGVAWSVVRPLMTIIILTVIFKEVGNFPDGGVPYAILVCAGALPWQFFSNAFSEASNSLIANSNMLTKVYFPRLIIPTSTVIVCLIDFFISFLILLVLMGWYSFLPTWRIMTIPLFLMLAITTSLGAGYFIAALNVKYRDFRYIIPFIVQFGLYISPVGFSSDVIPEKWRLFYSINPMVGVIDGFRWAILGQNQLFIPGFLLSILISVFLLILSIRYFRKMERTFADVI